MITHFAEPFEADEPEGSVVRGSQYMSRKDLQRIGLALVVFGIVAFPVYQHYKRQGEKSVCSSNMKAMGQALLAYGVDNDERLPPAYYPDANGDPTLHNGLPVTWATLAQSGMSKRSTFRCPSATADESAKVTPYFGSDPIQLTYGMFAGAAGRTDRQYERPNESVLLGETSNHGARETFDPLPLGANDGFLIGYDVTNAQGPDLKAVLDEIKLDLSRNAGDSSKLGLKEPSFVTRLAFYGSNQGKFDAGAVARHDSGIHVIFVDGSLGVIRAPAAEVGDRYRWKNP